MHTVILDFSADILTLSVQIWCPGLVREKLWSACARVTNGHLIINIYPDIDMFIDYHMLVSQLVS